MREISGKIAAGGLKVALVAARFNSFLVEQLVKGAVDQFTRHGGSEEDVTLVRVPGAYEIPFAVQKLAKTGKFGAVVALGAVIQGDTPHAGLITQTVARALSEISLDAGVIVTDGIVAADTLEQAIERCGTKQGNKGANAMLAAIEMADVAAQI